MKRALVPGSYDPVTVGHMDLIRRAAALFDEVHAVIFVNAEKKGGFFAPEERLTALKLACSSLPNVKAWIDSGMLIDYAAEHNIDAIVKGARNASDFDYELSLAMINRGWDEEAETVILPARQEFLHISSSCVRELIRYHRPLSGYVPREAEAYLQEIAEKKRA